MGAGWRVVDDLAEVVVAVPAALELEAPGSVADFPAPVAAVPEGMFECQPVIGTIRKLQVFKTRLRNIWIIREIRTWNDREFGERLIKKSFHGLV